MSTINRNPTLNVHPGQRVITTAGTTRTVAFIHAGTTYVYGPRGLPEPARVVCDAWGGEAELASPAALAPARPRPTNGIYLHLAA